MGPVYFNAVGPSLSGAPRRGCEFAAHALHILRRHRGAFHAAAGQRQAARREAALFGEGCFNRAAGVAYLNYQFRSVRVDGSRVARA